MGSESDSSDSSPARTSTASRSMYSLTGTGTDSTVYWLVSNSGGVPLLLSDFWFWKEREDSVQNQENQQSQQSKD